MIYIAIRMARAKYSNAMRIFFRIIFRGRLFGGAVVHESGEAQLVEAAG